MPLLGCVDMVRFLNTGPSMFMLRTKDEAGGNNTSSGTESDGSWEEGGSGSGAVLHVEVRPAGRRGAGRARGREPGGPRTAPPGNGAAREQGSLYSVPAISTHAPSTPNTPPQVWHDRMLELIEQAERRDRQRAAKQRAPPAPAVVAGDLADMELNISSDIEVKA
jgi:hypothetical protein